MSDPYGRPLDWYSLPPWRRLALWWGSAPRTPDEAEGCLAYAAWALSLPLLATGVAVVFGFWVIYETVEEGRAVTVATLIWAAFLAVVGVLNPLRLRRAGRRYIEAELGADLR